MRGDLIYHPPDPDALDRQAFRICIETVCIMAEMADFRFDTAESVEAYAGLRRELRTLAGLLFV